MPSLFQRDRQFKNLDIYLKQGKYPEAIELMRGWQPAYLALFQDSYPQQQATLRHGEFGQFWQECRENLRLNGYPDFRFMAQAGITDADFVTGYLFYLLALKSKKEKGGTSSKEFDSYLEQSIKFSSIHAVQTALQTFEIQKMEDFDSFCQQLVQSLLSLQKVANLHGTPGYIQLADGYLHLAIQARSLGKSTQSAAAFASVWKYLHLARLAEKDSATATHNAYFGLGLALSNPFKIESIDAMLQECHKLAGGSLPLSDQNLIKQQVLQEYKALKEGSSAAGQSRSIYPF